MTTRGTLLIGCPGSSRNYLTGVQHDLTNCRDFLQSAIGGAWYPSEVTTLNSPNQWAVQQAVASLRHLTYSLVVFTGHGYATREGTHVEIQPGTSIPVGSLVTGGARQTIVADCCRVMEPDQIVSGVSGLGALLKYAEGPDYLACRRLFDAFVEQCPTGLVELYSCSANEKSKESPNTGGYYLSALLDQARTVDHMRKPAVIDVVSAHVAAAPGVVNRSRGTQHPDAAYDRTGPHFPLSVFA